MLPVMPPPAGHPAVRRQAARRRRSRTDASAIGLLVALAAIVLAACGSSPAATSSPAASAAGSPAASSAVASPSPTPNVHAAPALEAKLPDSIGGVAMSKFSMGGADFLSGGTVTGKAQLKELLDQLGKTDADLLLADTYDPTGASQDQAAIFQVQGADPTKLLDLWVAAQTAITHGKTRVSNVTVGGRQLTRLEDFSSEPSRVTYAWSSGDSIMIVAASTDAVLQELVSKMAA
jgi:hypothetical protein